MPIIDRIIVQLLKNYMHSFLVKRSITRNASSDPFDKCSSPLHFPNNLRMPVQHSTLMTEGEDKQNRQKGHLVINHLS